MTWAGLVLGAGLGCKDDEAATSAAPVTRSETQTGAQSVSDLGAIDPELAETLSTIAIGCHLDATKSLACQNPQARIDLARAFNEGTRDRIAALPTLVSLLARNEPVMNVMVAEVLAAGFSVGLGEDAKPGAVSSAVTHGLIEAYNRFEEYRGHRIVPAATHAAALSGDTEALYAAMVDKRDLQGVYRMLRHMMVHGRLSALPQVKVALQDADNPTLALAGMEAMRYMPHWTSDEQATLCPLVLSRLSGPAGPMSTRAAQTSLHCRGDQLAAVLGTLRERATAQHLQPVELVALYGRCRAPQPIYRQSHVPAVTQEACQPVVALLAELAGDQKQPDALRAKAVDILGSQLPPAEGIPASLAAQVRQRVAQRLGKTRRPALVDALARFEGRFASD